MGLSERHTIRPGGLRRNNITEVNYAFSLLMCVYKVRRSHDQLELMVLLDHWASKIII